MKTLLSLLFTASLTQWSLRTVGITSGLVRSFPDCRRMLIDNPLISFIFPRLMHKKELVHMKSGGQGSMSKIHHAILKAFGKSTRALTDLLKEDASFGTVEQVRIENHIHVIPGRLWDMDAPKYEVGSRSSRQ